MLLRATATVIGYCFAVMVAVSVTGNILAYFEIKRKGFCDLTFWLC
jgi:hypothetical protein